MNSNNFPLILDCTLRDGGYYTNWDFNEDLVTTYFSALNKLPIDVIEIGYRSPPKGNYSGRHFYLPAFVIEKIKAQTNKDLAIILNEKDVRTDKVKPLLKPCIGQIKMVRLAVAPENFDRGIELSAAVKELGFQVAFNLMYASKWEVQFPTISQVKALNIACDYFYVVDSYGGLFPEDVERIFTYLKSELTIGLGFHGHNNLEMALANSLAAIQNGADIIDATIDGMGRGAGNLKTELLLSILYQRNKLEVKFDVLLEVLEAFLELKPKYNWGTNLPYMVSGSFSLPQNKVKEQVNKRYFSLDNIIHNVTGKGEKLSKVLNINVFSPLEKSSKVFIIGGGSSAEQHKIAIQEFLKDNPKIPIIFASSKNTNIFKGLENPQIHLIPGKELQRLKNYLSPEELEARFLVIPPEHQHSEDLNNLVFYKLLPEEEYYFPDSVTEYCLKTAKAFKAKEVYLIGYDGYGNIFNKAQQELFIENEMVFRHYQQENLRIMSVTPTEYTIRKTSIYSFFK
ncbi:4-hydroxy 2-oxovalerate aldolase [Salegentibacter sp. 24]|uniref:aldolase catalytic domain-containing protein n=1 Tax=Salegentibacter sp. 24 TaxID=2183986 RepID=UPI0010605FB9|nr:aldolase catalytic domain-containing protein [Salegentibacter sp. 24]TDN82170.1 4-hydroxy 2-oxovalerate aldolase [Salegentibacter sp. 24]